MMKSEPVALGSIHQDMVTESDSSKIACSEIGRIALGLYKLVLYTWVNYLIDKKSD